MALKSDAADMVDARGGEVKGDVSGERFESNIPFPAKENLFWLRRDQIF